MSRELDPSASRTPSSRRRSTTECDTMPYTPSAASSQRERREDREQRADKIPVVALRALAV